MCVYSNGILGIKASWGVPSKMHILFEDLLVSLPPENYTN